ELYKVGLPSERTNLPSEAVYSARSEVPRRSSWWTTTSPLATERESCLVPLAAPLSEKYRSIRSAWFAPCSISPRDSVSQYVSRPPRTCPSGGAGCAAWPGEDFDGGRAVLLEDCP